jgi:carbamoyltransferase
VNVLGISAHYHDSAAALVAGGTVTAAAAEERFTRQKHDPNFPKFAIDFCLKEGGMAAQELDRIVFYEEPHTKFTRVLSSSLAPFPFSRGAFVKAMKSWLGEKLWTQNEISKRLDVHPSKIEFIPHHLSHAAQAFLGSPFREAAILTVDAVGEWACTSLYRATSDGGLKFEELDEIPYPHSLGLVYAAFTAFLGFRPNDGECSTMALAAFGSPAYADEVRKVIRVQTDGTYEIDQSYFNFNQFGGDPFTAKFLDAFGQPRGFRDELSFDTLAGEGAGQIPAEHLRFADIAASVQLVLEEALLALAERLHKRTGSPNLCMAGGVALNCVANSRLLRESPFESLFIPPDPGDGGTALGAALYVSLAAGNGDATAVPVSPLTPFLGKHYDAEREVEMLRHINAGAWGSHRMRGCAPVPANMRLDIEAPDSFERLIPGVVNDIRRGKVVGWFQGRFEHGPRALGNRSLLTDPYNLDAAKRLSRSVKSRAPFRPYAFSVTAEDAGRVLDNGGPLPHTTRWMQSAEPVKADAARSVRAALHVDATTRVQVCAEEDNRRFHQLLSAYGQETGLAALLNTSFNAGGYPIVSSPAEALIIFARTDLDTLVIDDFVVRKVV